MCCRGVYAFILLLLLQVFWREAKTHEKSCPVVMDLAFLLDGSTSITSADFTRVKTFVKKTLLHFTISAKGTHVCVVVFSDVATVKLRFTDAQEAHTINSAIDDVTWPKGNTKLDLGLKKVASDVFKTNMGMRQHSQQVLVVTTDGRNSGGPLGDISRQLHASNIHIFALGIGKNVKESELQVMASRNSHVFRFSSVTALEDFADKFAQNICSVDRSLRAIIPTWIPNMVLERNHVIFSGVVPSEITCSLLCLRNPKCFSFNFMPVDNTCELTHSTITNSPGDAVIKNGAYFFELRFI